jgi:hypothetical protein
VRTSTVRSCCLWLVASVAIVGCGQSASVGPVVVGREAISRATLASFTTAIARGATLPWLSPELGDPVREAGALLIKYRWLIGEATDQGIVVSSDTATRVLHDREAAYPGGEGNYEASLRETGETQAVARLVVRAEIAAGGLRRKLLSRVPTTQGGEIEAYYRRHLARYRVRERRAYSFGERIDGPQELAAARRAIVDNYNVKQASAPFEVEINLLLNYPRGLAAGEERAVAEAIFSARPGVVVGPFKYHGHESLFKVDKIMRGYVRSLSQEGARIGARLRREAIARTTAEFIAGWRAKWTEQTKCDARYLVPGCKEYRGPQVVEEHPLSPE